MSGRVRRLNPLRVGLGRNSAWSVAATALVTAGLFAETVILARSLSPAALGVFFLIVAYPEAVQGLLDFRVRDAMTRYFGAYVARDQPSHAMAVLKLLWVCDLGTAAVSFAVVAATAIPAASILVGDDRWATVIIVYGAGMFAGSLDSASGTVMRVLNRFALSFAAGAIGTTLRLGLVGGVALAGGGIEELVWARVSADVLTTLAQGAMTLLALRPVARGHWRARISLLRGNYREIARFMLATNATGLFRTASTKLDVLLIGVLSAPVTVAIYRIAIQFGRAPMLFADSLLTAVYPRFTSSVTLGRRDDIRRLARTLTIVLTAIVVPVSVGAALVGGTVMVAVAGDAFRGAGTPFAICLLGLAGYTVFFWVTPLLMASGHASDVLRSVAVATLVQLSALVALVPSLGATGAALAFAAAGLTGLVVQVYFVRLRGLLTPT